MNLQKLLLLSLVAYFLHTNCMEEQSEQYPEHADPISLSPFIFYTNDPNWVSQFLAYNHWVNKIACIQNPQQLPPQQSPTNIGRTPIEEYVHRTVKQKPKTCTVVCPKHKSHRIKANSLEGLIQRVTGIHTGVIKCKIRKRNYFF